MLKNLKILLKKYNQLIGGFLVVICMAIIFLGALYLPWRQACLVEGDFPPQPDHNLSLNPVVTEDLRNIAKFQGLMNLEPQNNHLIPMEIRHLVFSEEEQDNSIRYKLLLCNYCGEFLLSFVRAINSTKVITTNVQVYNVHGHYDKRFDCWSDQFGEEMDMNQHYECENFLTTCKYQQESFEFFIQKLEFEFLGDPKRIRHRDFSKTSFKCRK